VSHLEFPLKNLLRAPTEEPALRRIWQRIDGRLPDARRRRRRIALMSVAITGVAFAGVALLVGARRDAGSLHLSDGHALVAVDAPAAGARLALSDGSTIELGGGARFEPLESSGTMFLGVLQRGSASFDVRPGGPRRWQIECGLATIEVVGTRFSCERAPGKLRVSVQRGAIVVRGERVADRARRLTAGESLDLVVGDIEAAPPAAASPDETAATGAAASLAQHEPLGGPSGAERTSWRELAHRGRPGEAFAALGAQGIRREARRLGVVDLLVLADVARLSGHPTEAVAPLERIVSDFAHDPQAPLAAFALGRLELDALDAPHPAAAALERALELGVPRSLREDVHARLIEAYDRGGDRAAARSAAQTYLREFPSGRHRAEMETVVAPN
jgi:transmembrane sensor